MLRNGWGRWQKAGSALLALSAALFAGSPGTVQARNPLAQQAAVETIAVAQLPPQGRSMLTLIYQGGPFTHDKDGVVFGNRERLLPANARGYYREYTVRTPGERTRGARRIVCGGLKPATPDACFYTDDHYASFRRIVP
jgi:ribonuclease T1